MFPLDEDGGIIEVFQELVADEVDIIISDFTWTLNGVKDFLCFFVSFHIIGVSHKNTEGSVFNFIQTCG